MVMQLTSSQLKLKERAAELSRGLVRGRGAEIDKSGEYPWDVVEALKSEGFMGMTIPPELGGQGLSFLDTVLVIEEMAKSCTVTARIVVESNMGAISTVMAYGTDAQRKNSLPISCSLETSRPSVSPNLTPAAMPVR
jgi:butyryl-CoA dehydrogenase